MPKIYRLKQSYYFSISMNCFIHLTIKSNEIFMRNQLFTPIIFLLFYLLFASNFIGQVRQKMDSTFFKNEIAGKNWVNIQIDDAHKKEIKIVFYDLSLLVISINNPSYTDIFKVVSYKIYKTHFKLNIVSEIKGDKKIVRFIGYLMDGILYLHISKNGNNKPIKWLPFQIAKD